MVIKMTVYAKNPDRKNNASSALTVTARMGYAHFIHNMRLPFGI